jgi:hypothetical protein
MKDVYAKLYDVFPEKIIFLRGCSLSLFGGKHYGDYVQEVLKYFHMEPNAEIFR